MEQRRENQQPDPQRRNPDDRRFGHGGQEKHGGQDKQGKDRPFGQPEPKKPGAIPDEDDAS